VIQIVNNTTGEVLFESQEVVHVEVRYDKRARATLSANTESVAVYLRDLARERAEIVFSRSNAGLYARMEV
jgi:hypothetical protein